jgi:NAD(P)-dependent dehydrogenase (short-subunit alcohol dehydrogenase family)
VPTAIDLTGRHSVVTGAGKGLGRAICLELARAGSDVFAVSRTESDLASLASEVAALGRRCPYLIEDLRGPEQAERLAAVAIEALGDIHVLVNAAGVSRNGPPESATEDQYDTTFDINVKAAFFCAQAIGRGMLARGRGRIINVSSQAGIVAIPRHALYSASKAALISLTKSLAYEWGPRGVTCNAVAPTYVITPEREARWRQPEVGGPMIAQIPLGRFGQPPEVGVVVAFLASDLSSLINGETVVIDGGYTVH